MFYRHNKTFWYQSWIFQHVLLAENSEDGLASSCVEFSIGLSCNPVWDWVTIGTRVLYWSVISANGHCTASQYSARTPYWTSMYTNQTKISSLSMPGWNPAEILPSFKLKFSICFITSCYVILSLSMVQAMDIFMIT